MPINTFKCAICERLLYFGVADNNKHLLGSVEFENNFLFYDGFDGKFEIQPKLNFPDDVKFPCQVCRICIDHLKSNDHTVKEYKDLRCDVCLNKYQRLFPQDTAWDCAAWIHDTKIECSFGSKFDTHIYKYKSENIPDDLKDLTTGLSKKNICDDCIQKLIDNNSIILDETNNL